MEQLLENTFDLWKEEGRRAITQNFEVFSRLLEQSKDFARCGNYDAAAVYAEMAASYAALKHCGLFVSLELEEVLLNIGKQVIPAYPNIKKNNSLTEKPQHILHVATSVQAIGGLSKMLWRWIGQDSDRSHSVVLTRQPRPEVPVNLRDAVSESGGKVYWLNQNIGSLVSWAKQLRKIAVTADIVVLHIYNHDVIPIIAFANKEESPPVILLDHADHMFWLGANVSDVVVNLRESGMELAQKRRGIDVERNILLPTILEPTHRKLSRTVAKQQLGLPENSIILLSIARKLKYKTINGVSYADAHISLLQKYKQAILVVVGSGYREDWSDAIAQTQGRIIAYPEREDTPTFYQAADIYVDSFPFISTTSLLEAGSYGVPLVSRYPYSDACKIFGALMPGLSGNLITVRDLEEYTITLSRLIENEENRVKLGELTRQKILDTHTGKNWLCSLNSVYHLANNISKVSCKVANKEEAFLEEPDVFVPVIHGWDFDLNNLIQSHLSIMPFKQRLHQWLKLFKNNSFYSPGRLGPLKYLVPEWVLCKIR